MVSFFWDALYLFHCSSRDPKRHFIAITAVESEFVFGCGPRGSNYKEQDQIGENQAWPTGETHQTVKCEGELDHICLKF